MKIHRMGEEVAPDSAWSTRYFCPRDIEFGTAQTSSMESNTDFAWDLGSRPSRLRFVVALIATCLVACSGHDGRSGLDSTSSTAPTPTDAAATSSTEAPPTSGSNPTPSEVDPYVGVLPAAPTIGTTTDEWFTAPDGLRRHFRLYVPSSVGQGDARPLLIALHGGLGTSAQFATNSGFDGLAESNGFVVVYPDGIGARPDGSGYQTWNGGYCCGPAARLDVDDVSFVRALIDLIESRMEIDPDRVFAAGHSNGAIMAYRLACELSDRIVAIGIQAGSLGVDECEIQAPVSVLHIHGTADANHPIDGGRGAGIAGVVFRSARVAVRRLAEADGCESGPLLQSNPSWPDIEIRTWTGCEGVAEVRLITVDGASHAWMGHAAASAMATGFVGGPYPGFDSSRAIWSFLSLHPRRSD